MSKSFAEHKAAHSPDAIAKRLSGHPRPSYIKDFIYGALTESSLLLPSLLGFLEQTSNPVLC